MAKYGFARAFVEVVVFVVGVKIVDVSKVYYYAPEISIVYYWPSKIFKVKFFV